MVVKSTSVHGVSGFIYAAEPKRWDTNWTPNFPDVLPLPATH
jgi:hypothetical protein